MAEATSSCNLDDPSGRHLEHTVKSTMDTTEAGQTSEFHEKEAWMTLVGAYVSLYFETISILAEMLV